MSCPKSKLTFYFIVFIIYMYLLIFIHNKIDPNFKLEEKPFTQPVNYTNNNYYYTKFDEDVVERILNDTRDRVEWELHQYNWSASGLTGLEDLLPEKGGTPLKILIISPWRSGSTYLGYLFSSLPGVVYYYEPLAHFNSQAMEAKIRENQYVTANRLKNVLKCENFNNSYLEFVQKDGTIKKINSSKIETRQPYYYDSRMWWYCKEGHELCDDPEFREKFCKMFPFQVVKDVHVSLPYVENMIRDEELNVRVVVLVRDPRATMHSRRLNDEECTRTHCVMVDPICDDMVSNYAAARRLLKRYPRRIKVLRFEDLALKPLDTVRDLLQFLNLYMLDAVQEFLLAQAALSNHTDYWVNKGEAFSWKEDMDFKQIDDIQDTCKEAMELWGYLPADNWTQQHSNDFLPISNYEIIIQKQEFR